MLSYLFGVKCPLKKENKICDKGASLRILPLTLLCLSASLCPLCPHPHHTRGTHMMVKQMLYLIYLVIKYSKLVKDPVIVS